MSPETKPQQRILYIALILAILALALGLRLSAAQTLAG